MQQAWKAEASSLKASSSLGFSPPLPALSFLILSHSRLSCGRDFIRTGLLFRQGCMQDGGERQWRTSGEGGWCWVSSFSFLKPARLPAHVSVRVPSQSGVGAAVCCFDRDGLCSPQYMRRRLCWNYSVLEISLRDICILVHGDLKQFVIEQTPSWLWLSVCIFPGKIFFSAVLRKPVSQTGSWKSAMMGSANTGFSLHSPFVLKTKPPADTA